uniref:Presequence protease, mitochondrial n=1 Tax=Rhabditophanes sp. KR3021 TaxID=114890 RepID=A0AC35TMD5_9BILA
MVRQLWELSANLKVRETIPLSVYRSKRSDLRVVVADVPGPMVHGYLSFPTEAKSDDGLPHTLEHLVFMGSKTYPYKGVLDVIANRCLASGTNAWTAQDHTCYTLSTAGSSGFIKILPVYIDHVLNPTLTHNQYLTEVHHINKAGEDAGVVYSEMQDYESEMNDIMERKNKELLLPNNHAYRVNTGGRLPAIRELCSNERVTEFHKQYYHLKNMWIVVTGMVDHDKVLESIEASETGLLATHIPQSFERPFKNAHIPDLTEKHIASIECPSDDDTKGSVVMTFHGPELGNFYESEGLEILFIYMTQSAVSPLEKDFVQLADPFASSVDIHMDEYTKFLINVHFSDVPVPKIKDVADRFLQKTIQHHKNEASFDMDRMKYVIEKQIQQYYMDLEKKPGNQIHHFIMTHQLYGNIDNNAELDERINDQRALEKLIKEPASFWANLITKYLSTNKYVCVNGIPSIKLVDQISAAEKKRISDQKKSLGAKGLLECAKTMKDADAANSANKPSEDLLQKFIVNDLESFFSYGIETASNLPNKKNSTLAESFPLPTYIHSSPTKFVEANIIIDTANISPELRKYLLLHNELIFESSAMIDGKLIGYEEVAKQATKDLISYSVNIGVKGLYERYMNINLKAHHKNYHNIAKWADIFLNKMQFDGERIEILAKKLANQAADYKRDGHSICSVLSNKMCFDKEANNVICSLIGLEKLHKETSKAAKKDATQSLKLIHQLKEELLKSPINVHIVADDKLIEDSIKTNQANWNFLPNCQKNELFSTSGYKQNVAGFNQQSVMGVGGTESSFIIQKSVFDKNFTDPDVAEVILFSQYLSQCEGPLWRKIRGKGLAYGANINVNTEKKVIGLSLYRCAQAVEAYEETKKLVLAIIDDKNINKSEFEAAKRSLVYELMEAEGSLKEAATTNMLAALKHLPMDYHRTFCSKVWNLDAEHCQKIASAYIKNLFDDTKSSRAIVVNPSKVKQITAAYPQMVVSKIDNLYI